MDMKVCTTNTTGHTVKDVPTFLFFLGDVLIQHGHEVLGEASQKY
jgi:hypothetical protein